MRILNEFTIPKIEEVPESETSTNDKGEEVTTTKTVKKSVDKHYVVKKPSRALYDEAELFYGVKLSEGIKAGLLTRALLAKRFNNDGGILSDPEKEKFSKMYMSLFEKQFENENNLENNTALSSEIEKLNELFKSGALNKEEFEKAKTKLLEN